MLKGKLGIRHQTLYWLRLYQNQKPKVEICCLALVLYNEKFLRRKKKIKNEEAQGILKFGNFCEFLRFLENFWLLFVIYC